MSGLKDVNLKLWTCCAEEGKEDVEGLKLALRKGGDLNCTDLIGMTPLIMASLRGHVDVVRHILQQKNVLINVTDQFNNSALHYAAFAGNIECAKLLLAAGAWTDRRGNENRTPIETARHHNHTELIREMEDFERDPEAFRQRIKEEVALAAASAPRPSSPKRVKPATEQDQELQEPGPHPLEDDLVDARGRQTRLQRDFDNITRNRDNIKRNHDNLVQELQVAQDKVAAAEARVVELEENSGSVTAEIDAQAARIVDLRSRLTDAREDRDTLRQECEDIEAQLKAMEEHAAVVEKQAATVVRLQQELDSASTRAADLQTQVAQAEQERDSEQAEFDATVAGYRQRVSSAQQQRDALRLEFDHSAGQHEQQLASLAQRMLEESKQDEGSDNSRDIISINVDHLLALPLHQAPVRTWSFVHVCAYILKQQNEKQIDAVMRELCALPAAGLRRLTGANVLAVDDLDLLSHNVSAPGPMSPYVWAAITLLQRRGDEEEH